MNSYQYLLIVNMNVHQCSATNNEYEEEKSVLESIYSFWKLRTKNKISAYTELSEIDPESGVIHM